MNAETVHWATVILSAVKDLGRVNARARSFAALRMTRTLPRYERLPNARRGCGIGLLLCLLVPAALAAQTPQVVGRIVNPSNSKTDYQSVLQPNLEVISDGILKKQETQKRVRLTAREMVSEILDVQLLQLEENGLEKTDLYRDIRTMRGSIDALVEAAMPQVLDLLGRVQSASPGDRDRAFRLAREKSREILVQLLVERQNLLKRLRMAEIAAVVRQVIAKETAILKTTEALPEKAPAQRELETLATAEDQRDIKVLFLKVKDLLKEMTTWGGPVGAEASDGFKKLENAKVDLEFDASVRHLEQAKFPDAATSEQAIIKALLALLETIERAQGLLNDKSDKDAVEKAIQQITERQKEVRESTKEADLAQEKDNQQLVQQQNDIQKQLDELKQQTPEIAKPLEQAADAAKEAAEKLFEQKQDEAVAKQEQVLEKLNKAAEQIQASHPPETPVASAREPADPIKDLEAAKKDVERIQQEQKQTSATAQEKPQEAKPQERQVAKELAAVPKDRHLPQEVNSKLGEANQAANEAARQMDQPQPQRQEATRQAEQAIQRAAGEIDKALADAEQAQLAAKLNQLAEAAQSLEQATAKEKEIAKQSQDAAHGEGLKPDQAKDMEQQQSGVEKTAADTAKAVAEAVPEAAKTLGEAAKPIRQAGEQLKSAEQKPGDASKPAAAEAGKQAQDAAEKLAQAAEQVRNAMAEEARQLAQLSEQQLAPTQQVQQSEKNATAEQSAQATSQARRRDSRSGDTQNPQPPDFRPRTREEPWIAELPPEVRGAIRANSQRRPPRGYEERLQRYFKNID